MTFKCKSLLFWGLGAGGRSALRGFGLRAWDLRCQDLGFRLGWTKCLLVGSLQ